MNWTNKTHILMGDKIMYEPRKRTAIDGKVWWCVFDTEKMQYNTILFGRYKLKRDCQYAIDRWEIRKEELKTQAKALGLN